MHVCWFSMCGWLQSMAKMPNRKVQEFVSWNPLVMIHITCAAVNSWEWMQALHWIILLCLLRDCFSMLILSVCQPVHISKHIGCTERGRKWEALLNRTAALQHFTEESSFGNCFILHMAALFYSDHQLQATARIWGWAGLLMDQRRAFWLCGSI